MKVLILGTGEVGVRRALRFIQAGADVVVTGGSIPNNLQELGATYKPVEKIKELVKWADLVIVASGDDDMNNKVANLAAEKLLNRADFPFEGNVIVPTVFSLGDAQISIFTGGKSPIMARMLRKKIQSAISSEDILQIELQDYSRGKLKLKIENHKIRRDYLYKILNNSKIKSYLKSGNLEDAKDYVDHFIDNINVDDNLKFEKSNNLSQKLSRNTYSKKRFIEDESKKSKNIPEE
jgi:precorrin-2 dehydrogenase/sirohydrochlorin ferrochelatase